MATERARHEFREVLERLLARAKRDEVQWAQVGPRSSDAEGTFGVRFPSSSITVAFFRPENEPDFYRAVLSNDKSLPVVSLFAYETDAEEWQLLSSIWQEAFRSVTGWDRALADAKEALQDSGTVGKDDDDIPF